jgi:NAD(P)-dependent dehydrogenase (short-subunit alcohol dehydrogenase family)
VAEPATPSRVALVSGAGRGIGRSLAHGLAAHGLSVAALGRDRSALDETVRLCRSTGVEAVAAVADVTDEPSVRAAVALATERLGTVDLLVNNAGRTDAEEAGLADADVEDVVSVIEVNLIGPLRLTHAVLAGMRTLGHGRVLNVNSGFAFRRESRYTGYGVSKAGLARLTDVLAHQLSDDGIAVLDVSPGLVQTDMTASMPMWQREADPPWGDVEDIVGVACALADGRLDPLSGHFVHAAVDDLDALLAVLPAERDARTLGLRLYGAGDPLDPSTRR